MQVEDNLLLLSCQSSIRGHLFDHNFMRNRTLNTRYLLNNRSNQDMVEPVISTPQEQYQSLRYWLEYKARYRLWSWRKWLAQFDSIASTQATPGKGSHKILPMCQLNEINLDSYSWTFFFNPLLYFQEKVLFLIPPFGAQKWHYFWRFPGPFSKEQVQSS